MTTDKPGEEIVADIVRDPRAFHRTWADSPLLKDWETADLGATVEGIPGGVLVRIFRK